MKENKTRYYSLDEVVTSHNKPKLQTCSSLTEDCQKKLCSIPCIHHRATLGCGSCHQTPSKLCHTGAQVGTRCFGKLETSPWGWNMLGEGQCQVERLQIEALNGRKWYQSLSLNSVWDSVGQGQAPWPCHLSSEWSKTFTISCLPVRILLHNNAFYGYRAKPFWMRWSWRV